MEMELPALPSVDMVQERLDQIFPEGTPNRNYCTRLSAARTVFTMLYVGAVEGAGRWLTPMQVYRMSGAQASMRTDEQRLAYARLSAGSAYTLPGERWYADNSREQIRDETLKEGLMRVGAVVTRPGVATTSNQGRYALKSDFADLFTPTLAENELAAGVQEWRRRNLSPGALARIEVIRRGAAAPSGKVTVVFPSGEVRHLEPGPSSVISKAVIEEFAPRYLAEPAVILLSESGNKIIARDDALAQSIGLKIKVDRLLPDVILFDLQDGHPLLVFVEVVATDGPISDSRKASLIEVAATARFAQEHVAFVTAYLDRGHRAFKKTVQTIAWRSFVWFAAEPDNVLVFHEGRPDAMVPLSSLDQL